MFLRNIPNIRINGVIKITNSPIDWRTLFRVWNYKNEDTSCDSIYSLILQEGQIVFFDDTGYSINTLMEKFYNALPYPYVVAQCKFEYNFLFTPVNLEYDTDGEMEYFCNIINKCLKGTSLSVFLMLSHFKQSANKKGGLKPEHYHFIIPQTVNDEDYQKGIYVFIDNLKKEKIFGKIIIEVE